MPARFREPMAGAVVVENCDSVTGSEHEPALFAMLERGTPLLLTGRAMPAQWQVSLPDLASRLRALVAFELGEPDEGLLMALAVKLFADRQVIVPEAVVIRLVQGLERSPAAIRDFIARADREALSRQKPINLQLIRELMAGLMGSVMTDSPISPKLCAMSNPSQMIEAANDAPADDASENPLATDDVVALTHQGGNVTFRSGIARPFRQPRIVLAGLQSPRHRRSAEPPPSAFRAPALSVHLRFQPR